MALAAPSFALSEAEVEALVGATSREEVTGSVLIWFLCAIAFLKVSQKIDSFMASLGVNVGHTGGSMLAEAMIATRGVTTIAGLFGGGSGGGRSGAASSGGASGSSGASGFLKGGLAGVVSRKITNDAVKTATTTTSAVDAVKSTAAATDSQTSTVKEQQSAVTRQTDARTGTSQSTQTDAVHSASAQTITQTAQQSEQSAAQFFQQTEQTVSQAVHQSEQSAIQDCQQTEQTVSQTMRQSDQSAIQSAQQSEQSMVQTFHQSEQSSIQSAQQSEHTARQTANQTTTHTSHAVTRTDTGASTPAFKGVGMGGAIFAKSLLSGGSFANDVIGTVAKGDIRTTGSITGDLAAQSARSYLGYAPGGGEGKEQTTFSHVEIGGGRITGMVGWPGSSEPIAFGMYHAEQYAEPKGDFSRVRTQDGALWYTQLAQDTVERKPYQAAEGKVAYHEQIVKKLPDPPKRKDKL